MQHYSQETGKFQYSQDVYLIIKIVMIVVVYIAVKNLFEENIVFDWGPKGKKNLSHR